jgi:hypothetical protein
MIQRTEIGDPGSFAALETPEDVTEALIKGYGLEGYKLTDEERAELTEMLMVSVAEVMEFLASCKVRPIMSIVGSSRPCRQSPSPELRGSRTSLAPSSQCRDSAPAPSKQLVLCRIEKRPPRLDLAAYPYLPKATVRTTSAADYAGLLNGKAA